MKGGIRDDLFMDSGGRVKEKVTDMVEYEKEYCFFKQKVLLYCAQRDHSLVSSTQTETFITTLLTLFQEKTHLSRREGDIKDSFIWAYYKRNSEEAVCWTRYSTRLPN